MSQRQVRGTPFPGGGDARREGGPFGRRRAASPLIWVGFLCMGLLAPLSLLPSPAAAETWTSERLTERAEHFYRENDGEGMWWAAEKFDEIGDQENAVRWWVRSGQIDFSLEVDRLVRYLQRGRNPKRLYEIADTEFRRLLLLPQRPDDPRKGAAARYAITALETMAKRFGRQKEMIAFFEEARTKLGAPRPFEGLLRLAIARLHQDRWRQRKALAIYRKLLETYSDPKDEIEVGILQEARRWLAADALERMDLERAKRLYGDIVRERAFNPIHTTNAYFWLGICALMENDLVRAYQAFLIVRKKFKDYGHWAVRLNVGRCEQYIALLDDARSGSLLRRVRATLLLNSVRLRRGKYPWFLIFFLLPLAFVVDTFVRSRSAQARGGWEDYPLLAGLFGVRVPWRVGIWLLPGVNAAVLAFFLAFALAIGDDVLLGLLTTFVTLLAAMAVTLWITLLHRVNLDLAQKRPLARGGRVVLLAVALSACLLGGLWLLSLWRYLTWDPYRWRAITQAWRLR